MNFQVNPISSNTVSIQKIFNTYKQSQNQAQEIASVVYASLEYLTDSENGISLQALNDLNQTLINENLTQNSAFKLVNTVIARFDSLSSDGEVITLEDFKGAVKFSAAESFFSDSAVSTILKQTGVSVSDAVSKLFGAANAQTVAFVALMESLSDDTVGKLIANLNSEEKSKQDSDKSQNQKTESQNYASDVIDITTSSKGIKLPVNILV